MIPQNDGKFDFTNPRVRASRRLLEKLIVDALHIFGGDHYDRHAVQGFLRASLVRAERTRLVKARIDGVRSRQKNRVLLPMMFVRTDAVSVGRMEIVVTYEALEFVRASVNFLEDTARIEFRLDPGKPFELYEKSRGTEEFVLVSEDEVGLETLLAAG